MARTITIALILMLLGPLVANAQDPESARKELEELNIPYTSAEFIDRAEKGDTATEQLFLDSGMDPNTKTNNDMTVLMKAAYFGRTETVEALLAKGADVNAKDNDGWTALIVAAQNGWLKLSRFALGNQTALASKVIQSMIRCRPGMPRLVCHRCRLYRVRFI